MATGPGHGKAAGLGHLRASHADREQVIETLKAAFVQGRLTKDELDTRAPWRSPRGPTPTSPRSPPISLPGWPALCRPGRGPGGR